MQNSSIEGFQVSPQQKRLWLLQQNESHQPYRVQGAILIEGEIDRQILELAINKVVDKHEILRTNFQALKGMNIPIQVISARLYPAVNFYDLTEVETEIQEQKIELLFQEDSQIIFDLQKKSVLNIKLIWLSPVKHILLVATPALCADSTSLHNFVRKIGNAYTACLHEREYSQETLQYADIAAWQNEFFAGEDAEIGKEYWRKQNISSLVESSLPYEKEFKEELGFNPNFITINLSSNLAEKLRSLAVDANKARVFLMASWQILLWRITGKSEMAIAIGCDGRNYEELESSIGLLAKYLPVQVNLDENSTFSEILQQVNQAIGDVYQWQESLSWESKESSFFPFVFDFESLPERYLAQDISFSILKQYSCIDRFKVKLFCLWTREELTAELHYDASLLEKEDIERLAAEFETLLTAAIDSPETAIAQLEILSPSERQQLLVEFNNTKTDYPPYHSIHHWFEEQVKRTPDNIAVVYENQKLTYLELNAKADRLAHYLISLGVTAEVVVALCVERSLDLIIGILGIIKAGGAYLPLDPILPAEAIAFRLQDAKAPVILTQQHLVEKLLPNQAHIVCLDAEIPFCPPPSSPVFPSSENQIYIIYTSGSTGKPKGVAVEHRQLINYLNGILKKFDLPEGSSFAIVSTFAADLGNTAIFSALCSGGSLHIISSERATDPVALTEYCRRHPIDCLKIVPSHLAALLTSANSKEFLPRKQLILGGEAATWELIKQVHKQAPFCQILNHYGPTETTVGVLTYTVDLESISSRPKSAKVPLGRPLANTQIYLLDNNQQPVPLGGIGEIYIGGDSVARGYIERSELTAERFIQNPFNRGRLYKTGDLARYLPDGNLEFFGRMDDQVKIHGFRIEVGEIEAALRQYPNVQNVVVLAREDKGQKRLVAYLVFQERSPADFNDLRNFLKQKLPEYMVPSNFVQLKALPLTANGKIDRKALPEPETFRPELAVFVAPRTAVEKALAEIWAQLLSVEKVGIHDNFFELGGDSIISIQAIAKANQIGLRLTPKQIFEHQTIAKLAVLAETTPVFSSEPDLVVGECPLIPIQHSFFAQNLAEPHHWNQAFLLEFKQEIDCKLLEKTFQHLLEHHDALRLRFRKEGDNWQSVSTEVAPEVPFSKIDLSEVSAAEQASVIETKATEFQTSLDLTDGPLFRVVLFDLGEKPSRLLIVIHHLVVDGVSWRILLEDLQTAYQQLSQDKQVNLPPKTTSFKKWAECLQEYGRSPALHKELDYWLSESRKQISALPIDYSEGINTISSTRTVSVFLSEAETQSLLKQVPQAYQTQVNDVLLTALVQAFSAWTKQRKLLVNLESHGREEIFTNLNLSRTIGWFTNLFPVFLELEETVSPGEALKAIKEQLRNIPNRGIGYGVLRYLSPDLSVRESLSAMPQAEVCFNYLGQFDQAQSALFKIAPESSGPTRSLQGSRRHLLDINGFVTGKKLQLDWTYSAAIHQEVTVSNLAENFIKALLQLIAHCQSPEAGGYTPSDFPKANVSQKDLERLLAKINRGSEKKS